MNIVLIGNYKLDQQESMNRFTKTLANGLLANGISHKIWLPPLVLGMLLKDSKTGLSKWIGYIDKYLFAPMYFFVKSRIEYSQNRKTVFHICDHSNSLYLPFFHGNRILITCHDVIAIRGAMGFKDANCEASKFGKLLQSVILKNLIQAPKLVMVSNHTQNQFCEIANIKKDSNHISVIHNGLNQPFIQLKKVEIEQQKFQLPQRPFLLHVGSNLPRKNRILTLKILEDLGENYKGDICFAGKGPDNTLKNAIEKMGLSNRIVVYEKPNHELLNLLYNSCHAFIFPSKSEGFGWPIIEAQACGAPVICSNIEPFVEIAGQSALLANPNNSNEFVIAINKLDNPEFRESLISKGKENCKNFSSENMHQKYINVYKSIAQ